MRIVLVALLLVAAASAGCLQSKDKDGDGSGTSTPTGSGSASKTGTSGAPAGPRTATLLAAAGNQTGLARVNGTAPLAVNFTLNATAGSTSWRLSFGDGASANGTALPAAANHTYVVGGNFSANLTVTYAAGATANATVALHVSVPTAPGGGKALPDVTHFEFGESFGCTGDAHSANHDVPLNCVSFQGGPDASGIDGHWLALDERYWGLTLTTTMDDPTGANGDSDCYFLAPDAQTEVGEGSNGGELCLGVVPEGTGWLFLYPWGFPATAMTADFSTP